MVETTPRAFASKRAIDGTEEFYSLSGDELSFFKTMTGITDEVLLKEHIIAVQRDAYKSHAYPCIATFSFLKLKLSKLPAYDQLIALGKARNSIYLDLGCCFGTDVRKAVLDGYPMQNIITTDIIPDFWNLGHKLFKTTPKTFPIPFLAGDAFKPDFLEAVEPLYTAPSTPRLNLSELTSLNSLHGHVSVISVCAIFHLFSAEEAQFQLAQNIAGLLSSEPGSMILGYHIGREEAGVRVGQGTAGTDFRLFCHSPESWTELWDGKLFWKGTVRVEARLMDHTTDQTYQMLEWSVTRL
ncbi:hypothetical protein DICSQDRAFT_155718 [Dichomitus squalens LYAD-421 SS1]|uniref:Methyltransferase domain-containing protein n=1 Tax=Dichomitus squalens (strain LYAD-421) TaxID=732165 RepID=R7SXC7_DICSQ|nr:uncharacterized protein DICSQDRAFT_155718 [Dichomitus squalens LYAD-421 SS1]EJF60603.1 hypothetical protein DICSQDRAFT_155718 [Dichomitus squalens LYAD-421 SS1]